MITKQMSNKVTKAMTKQFSRELLCTKSNYVWSLECHFSVFPKEFPKTSILTVAASRRSEWTESSKFVEERRGNQFGQLKNLCGSGCWEMTSSLLYFCNHHSANYLLSLDSFSAKDISMLLLLLLGCFPFSTHQIHPFPVFLTTLVEESSIILLPWKDVTLFYYEINFPQNQNYIWNPWV